MNLFGMFKLSKNLQNEVYVTAEFYLRDIFPFKEIWDLVRKIAKQLVAKKQLTGEEIKIIIAGSRYYCLQNHLRSD